MRISIPVSMPVLLYLFSRTTNVKNVRDPIYNTRKEPGDSPNRRD